MSTITVDENQLEEIVSKVVQQRLKLTFQDMDEVRKSTAGAIVRVETKIEALADAVEELKTEFTNTRAESRDESGKLRIEIANSRADTRAEFERHHAETKAEFEKIHEKLKTLEDTQTDSNGRLAKVEGTLKLLVALFFATFGIFASLLAKLIFFP